MTNTASVARPFGLGKKSYKAALSWVRIPLQLLRVWCVALALVSCQSAPITHRPQLMIMDEEKELALGSEVYRDMVEQATLVRDARLNGLVEKVGRAVAAATGRDMDWEFTLVDEESPNAYCLPGGKVVVHSGLLPLAENEAGLAAVIAHEVGHAMARHGAERGSHAMVLELGMELVNMGLAHTLAEKTKLRMAWGVDYVISMAFPFSRIHEMEADEMGLLYMARAGYDPREAVRFWERIVEREGDDSRPYMKFLFTHPTDTARWRKIQLLIPRAMKEYDNSVKLGKGDTIL
ncbi:MAG: M48 family metallopeptidase [Nitrospinota bacterium]|nr:M48 family metallopeptidase [Nitrospinota bacterium]MDH5677864.1 M48 family metallopeptidase [Nitrospinota bacterium]MDH5756982.1 M48 family metallopeptidase [Nitrospinota bacterium]